MDERVTDTNALLRNIRRSIETHFTHESYESRTAAAQRAAELFEELDRRLKTGEAFPTEWANSLPQYLGAKERDDYDLAAIAAAREYKAEDGVLEVDDEAITSRGDDDDGCYVLAWVWVDRSLMTLPETVE